MLMPRLGLLLSICVILAAQTLEPGRTVTVHLSGAQTASLVISTQPDRYLRIVASSPDTSVEAALLDPKGGRVAVTTSLGGTGGTAEVAGLTDGGGSFQITLRLTRKDTTPRDFSVSLSTLDSPDPKKRTDAEAFRAYARAMDPQLKSGSIEAFNQALQSATKAGDDWLVAATLISRCQAYLQAGDFPKGIAAAEAALAGDGLHKDQRVDGALLYNAALGHLQHEESRASIPLFERAASLQRDSLQQYELSSSLHNLAVARWLLGDCTPALEEARQALAIRRELHDRPRQAYSLMAIAKDYFCLGDAQHALDTYAEVAPLWLELKDQANQAAVLNDRGLLYSYLGEHAQAEAAHQEALALRTGIKDKPGLVESLVNLGQLDVSLQKYRAAQSYCERALSLAHEIHYQRGAAYALLNLAEAMIGNGKPANPNPAEARRMLLDAIHTFSEEGHRPGEAWAWQTLGKLDRSVGDLSSARDDFDHALALEQEIGDRNLECITLVELARLHRAQSNSKLALQYADRAISLVEQSRASLMAPDLRAAWLSSKRDAYGLRISLLWQDHAAAAALATSEQAHSRVLLDALAESAGRIGSGLDPRFRTELDHLDAQLNARSESLARVSGSKAEAAELRRVLDRLLAKKQELEVRIRQTNPRYASLALPSPATVDEIRRYAMDDDTVLLEYYVRDQQSYLWALTSQSLDMFQLAGRSALEQSARALYEAMTERNRWPSNETPAVRGARLARADLAVAKSSAALSATLVGPARRLLKHRVIVVPDGPLHTIPFPLLLPAASREIVVLPSASIVTEMRKDRPDWVDKTQPALLIADPVFGADDERVTAPAKHPPAPAGPELPRLEWSRREVQSIASLVPRDQVKILLDFAADSEVLRHGDLSRYAIIHIASHSLLDTEHPALSAIVLSTVDRHGNAHDGQVQLHEIYDLSIRARLVVLSACRTAMGKELSGEGMIGLSRGFLYAGAQSVLATLWSVDDRATAQFMTRFYRALWNDHRRPSEALRIAQQWMMGQEEFRAPYYWAGYTLTGDWH